MSKSDSSREVQEPRLCHRIREPFIDLYETFGVLEKTLVWVVLTFLIGLITDIVLHSEFRWTWIREQMLEHAIEAMFLGVFIYTAIDATREERTLRRVNELAYLNHHIRNALQVIEMAGLSGIERPFEMIKDASGRIQRCLEKMSHQEDSEINEMEPQKP